MQTRMLIGLALPPVIGNAHLLLLHLPIGMLAAAVLLELWTWRNPDGRRLLTLSLAANAVFAVLAAAAGWLLAEQGGYPPGALADHRWAGVTCAGVAVLAWWLRARRGVIVARLGLLALVVATTWAGHLGATLTHGDSLMAWSRATPAGAGSAGAAESTGPASAAGEAEAHGGVVASAAERAAAELPAPEAVHPLLVKHCVECHGPEKQKGRLRLDSLAAARAAGKSGEIALVPGDAEGSELIRRIGLTVEDDELMPPAESSSLTEAERAELVAWVAGLAPGR